MTDDLAWWIGKTLGHFDAFDLPVFVQIAFPRKHLYSYFLKVVLMSWTMCAGDDKPSSSPWGVEANNEGLYHLAEHEVKGSSLVLYGYINPSVPSEVLDPTMRDFTIWQNVKSKV
jgi:hypothetical protein